MVPGSGRLVLWAIPLSTLGLPSKFLCISFTVRQHIPTSGRPQTFMGGGRHQELFGSHKGLLDHPIGRVNCSNPVSSLLPSGLPLIPLEQSELPGQCGTRLQPSRFARCLPGLRCTPSSFKFIHWYLLMTAWVVGYSKQQCDRLFCIAALFCHLFPPSGTAFWISHGAVNQCN